MTAILDDFHTLDTTFAAARNLRPAPGEHAPARRLRIASAATAADDIPVDMPFFRDARLAGVTHITLLEPIALGAHDAPAAARWLAFMREAATFGIAVAWEAARCELDVAQLVHLPPPHAGGPDAWRAKHAPDALYWRRGPRFAIVYDDRLGDGTTRTTIDDPAMLAALEGTFATVRRADAGAPESVDPLIDERIVACVGDWLVGLPLRKRRWPVEAVG